MFAHKLTHAKRSKLIQVFAIWSLLVFVHIVAMSFLAVIVWMIVLPAETTLTPAWIFYGIVFP